MNPHLKKVTAAGLLVSLGIIFGDIGTSPLYVFKAIMGERPISDELVYGGISCVFWTLTLQTTFKYILLTLQADNKGEGGIFSLYALVWRYRHWLYFPAIVGAGTLLADGIITPPISVASAIEGLNGVKGMEELIVPGNNLTVGIVIGIISMLFFFQQFGTKVVGSSFGPIMFIWFSMIMFWGILSIAHYPAILAAFSPYYAIHLLVHYPNGFWLLGAVFLCTTGAEALYSDLGHCGKKNIQVSWIFVKIALIANYFGQAAWLLHSGKTHLEGLNPFYEIMPDWFLLPGIIIATLATIIASQALISGSFTLISEAVSMNFWPRITIKYPTNIRGQIYIPSINWLLWGGCVGMMLYFRDSGKMEAAYGFSIVVAMLMTTTLMFYYMKFVKKWASWLMFAILLVFLVVEISFFITNVAKIKQRWMFLIFEITLVFVMYIWYKARKITNRFLQFESINNFIPALTALSNNHDEAKYATHLVYLTKANSKKAIEKRILESILTKRPKRADVYWFLHIERTDEPYTMEYHVEEIEHDKIIRVEFRLGFRIQPRMHLYFRKVMEEMVEHHELNVCANSDEIALNKHNISGDIRYVILQRFLSVENEFSVQEGFILNSYFAISKMAQTDKKAFGLDWSDTDVEKIPLVVAPIQNIPLKRTMYHAAPSLHEEHA
ncbi:KUP/HAK/KT family potassium transporter [Parasediminibacterium sp. JCM 36343]|uniref:KUP/HAK/KT family potassium transporter n=1 Tax=Parasediminibacterium sp. JCM 36343 TaxID=3374279 RepID=UPI00397A9470